MAGAGPACRDSCTMPLCSGRRLELASPPPTVCVSPRCQPPARAPAPACRLHHARRGAPARRDAGGQAPRRHEPVGRRGQGCARHTVHAPPPPLRSPRPCNCPPACQNRLQTTACATWRPSTRPRRAARTLCSTARGRVRRRGRLLPWSASCLGRRAAAPPADHSPPGCSLTLSLSPPCHHCAEYGMGDVEAYHDAHKPAARGPDASQYNGEGPGELERGATRAGRGCPPLPAARGATRLASPPYCSTAQQPAAGGTRCQCVILSSPPCSPRLPQTLAWPMWRCSTRKPPRTPGGAASDRRSFLRAEGPASPPPARSPADARRQLRLCAGAPAPGPAAAAGQLTAPQHPACAQRQARTNRAAETHERTCQHAARSGRRVAPAPPH